MNIFISTHTPVRVWPIDMPQISADDLVSTHTPVRVWLLCDAWSAGFVVSTHTPVRVWRDGNVHLFYISTVSTHTPVRVWRRTACRWPGHGQCFNSHTREGVTSWCVYNHWWISFNSHTREGVTTFGDSSRLYPRFNSHTREGVTVAESCLVNPTLVSTHTPVRVWLLSVNCTYTISVSTHTPVRVWQYFWCKTVEIGEFQLTHPWGCDRCLWAWRIAGNYCFNSHTREGVTRDLNEYGTIITFQLTHPWGCDILFTRLSS